ncbi:MAG: multifunctional CCA addition/repair protein [Gammaproteobacteria bacterium]
METYLVGGAVRDQLLQLPVQERDWVVVGATPQQMLDLGYKPVGKDFPVFLHPETGEEYALARTERKSGHGYKGFQVQASPEVTLEQDLLRRDLTINAMALDGNGQLIDPYDGEEDLRNGLLRHVSPAFVEDPVRILRVARFAARFRRWGFHLAHDTLALMRTMVQDGEVDYLVPERVWAELAKTLQTDRPAQFFKVLHSCGALAVLFPELEPLFGTTEEGHGEAKTDALRRFDRAAELDALEARFALLGWILAAVRGAEAAAADLEALCARARIPNEYRDLAVLVARHGTDLDACLEQSPDAIMALLEACDALRRPERFARALRVCRVAHKDAWPQEDYLLRCLTAAAAVNAAGLVARGLKGPEVGQALQGLRVEAIAKVAQP